jgi:capsular polysaccharide biosynthesis protein
MNVQIKIPSSRIGSPLRELEHWTTAQYVSASQLESAERRALAEPAEVPNVHMLRRTDGVWRPRDYEQLPKIECAAPGYTMLRGVHLLPGGLALAPDGRFVRDDRTRLTPPTLSPAFARHLSSGPEGRLEWPVGPEVIEKGILVSGPGSKVYGHQLLDYLPGLALLDDVDAVGDWPVLVRDQTPDWTRTMIREFTGRRREIKMLPGEGGRLRTSVEQLCVPWVVRSPSIHPIVRRVFGRIVRAAGGRPQRGAADARRIYVVRGESAGKKDKRRLEQRAEVERMFAARGFELIRPELLPFMDQVRLFADAGVVAGEAGSGLHGTIFSAAGIVTLELRPSSFNVLGQPAIAILQRHTFASVTGTDVVDPDEADRPWGPWTIELEALEERLEELEL